MIPKRHINQAGLNIIKACEGIRLKPYMDANDGWTVGYGHLLRPHELRAGQPIKKNYTKIECEALLVRDVAVAEATVGLYVLVDLAANQFSALVSFNYNIGPANFRDSTLVRKLNQNGYQFVPYELSRWRLDDGKIEPGLVKRRMLEGALFVADGEMTATIEALNHRADQIYTESKMTHGKITEEAMRRVAALCPNKT